ncbi:MAG TPA: hypothetical protein VMU29_11895 [Smithella sp.]|nr:hypothetical protein [Smithella sp.]
MLQTGFSGRLNNKKARNMLWNWAVYTGRFFQRKGIDGQENDSNSWQLNYHLLEVTSYSTQFYYVTSQFYTAIKQLINIQKVISAMTANKKADLNPPFYFVIMTQWLSLFSFKEPVY